MAHIISGLAQGISLLAVPWYFAKQGLSSEYNLYYGFLTLFIVFWGLYAGTIVDKYARTKVFIGANLVQFIVLASIAALGFINQELDSSLVFVVLAISFLGFNIHYPNMYAFLQEMTSPEEYTKVSSAVEIVGQTTSVISGALAAVLLDGGIWNLGFEINFNIPKWELWEIFALDALTYAISIILISSIKYIPLRSRTIETGSLSERLQSGFQFLNKNRRLFAIGLFSYCVFACVMVQIYSLLPVYINHYLKANGQVFATSDLIFAVGALLAGVSVSKFLKAENLLYFIPLFMFLNGFAYLGAYLFHSVYLFYAICFLFGFSNSATRIARISYLLSKVPNHLLGRVNSIFLVFNIVERSAFIFLFGTSIFQKEQINLAYLIVGVFILMNMIGFVWVRKKEFSINE